MDLPYGVADFKVLRDDNLMFVDKSGYIRLLESHATSSRYLAWLRPRRFGKSLFMSMLCYYYDIGYRQDFEHLFGGLEVGRNPTPERNKYLILRLELTGLSNLGSLEELERSFVAKLRQTVDLFFETYGKLIPASARAYAARHDAQTPAELMSQVINLVASTPYKLYVLIDEYDNFTNDLVFRGRHKTYEAVLHGAGFLRDFFKILKEGAGRGIISRIFLTGVSPVTLDDLGSGANMFSYPFLEESLQAMNGFTEADVRALLEPKLQELGIPETLENILQDMRFYYNGYRFARRSSEGIFNPDMVLHFLGNFREAGQYPEHMLDQNLRMDYSKLRALMVGQGDTPRADAVQKLLQVVETGEVSGQVQPLFPLTRAWEPEYFTSLLFYHGLVTLHPEEPAGKLSIPNFVIRELLWENIRGLLGDVFSASMPDIPLDDALRALASQGNPLPFLRLVQLHLFPKLSNRDLIKFREPMVKMLLLAWLSWRNYQQIFSELEHIGGYSDLILVPSPQHPWAKVCVLLEIKYVKLAEFKKDQLQIVETRMQEGEAQLATYADDPRLEAFRGSFWTRMTIVFVGRQAIYYRAPGQPTLLLEPEIEEDSE